jgi:hypothetical protein
MTPFSRFAKGPELRGFGGLGGFGGFCGFRQRFCSRDAPVSPVRISNGMGAQASLGGERDREVPAANFMAM